MFKSHFSYTSENQKNIKEINYNCWISGSHSGRLFGVLCSLTDELEKVAFPLASETSPMTPDSRHLGEPGIRGPKDICPVQPLPVTPLLILLIEQTDPLLKRGRSSRTPLSCPFPLLIKREGLVLLWNAESCRGHNLRSVLGGGGGWSQGVMDQRAEGARELQWDPGKGLCPWVKNRQRLKSATQ